MGQKVMKFWLLNKRLFKKYSFWLILCLVPLMVAGMRFASTKDRGIACIAIYQKNDKDVLAAEIIQQMTEEKTILRYILCETEEKARAMVEGGKADAAWLFPENLQAEMEETVASKSVEPIITMVEREDSVILVLAREILCSALYPYYSYEAYRDFIRDDCGLTELNDEELLEYYNETKMEGNLFQVVLLDGTVQEDKDYLLSPIRGMLALWLVLCGLAASVYFMQDEQEGVFDRMPLQRRLLAAFGMQAVLLFDGVLILLIALKIGGLFTFWPVEILSAVLLSCCIAVMANLLRMLCRIPERLGSVIPILLLVMLVLSPVFVDINGWRAVKLFLPTDYYLHAIHDSRYLGGMAIYALIGTGFCMLGDIKMSGGFFAKK